MSMHYDCNIICKINQMSLLTNKDEKIIYVRNSTIHVKVIISHFYRDKHRKLLLMYMKQCKWCNRKENELKFDALGGQLYYVTNGILSLVIHN